MDSFDRPTVEQAIYSFLVVCAGAPDAYKRLDSFIAKLSKDPRWTEAEVDEVHARIVARLIA
jgi:hypothetical protein